MLGYTCMSSISILFNWCVVFSIYSTELAHNMTFERVVAHCLSISRHLLESTVNLRSPWVASYMAWAELVRSVNLSYSYILSLSILNGKLHSIHATVLLSICCRYLKRSFKQHHHYQVSSSLNSGCRLRRLGPMAVIDSSSQAPVLGLTIEWRRAEHVDQIKVTFSPGS